MADRVENPVGQHHQLHPAIHQQDERHLPAHPPSQARPRRHVESWCRPADHSCPHHFEPPQSCRNQPRDATTSLIHRIRLRSVLDTGYRHRHLLCLRCAAVHAASGVFGRVWPRHRLRVRADHVVHGRHPCRRGQARRHTPASSAPRDDVVGASRCSLVTPAQLCASGCFGCDGGDRLDEIAAESVRTQRAGR